MEKQCNKCKEVKPITEFSKKKTNPDGHQRMCKSCSAVYIKQYSLQHHETNLLRSKKWYENNRETELLKSREYRQSHKNHIAEQSKVYRQKNKDKIRETKRVYHQKNKDKIRETNIEYYNKHKEHRREHRREHSLPSQQWRFTIEYRDWRQSIYNRDNHTCQHCGKNHCKVHAHHIKPAKDHPELRFDLDNGICLCAECHKNEHSILLT